MTYILYHLSYSTNNPEFGRNYFVNVCETVAAIVYRLIKLDSHISFLLSLTHSRHCYTTTTTTTTKFVLKHEVLDESKNNPFLPPRSVSVLVSVTTSYRWI